MENGMEVRGDCCCQDFCLFYRLNKKKLNGY